MSITQTPDAGWSFVHKGTRYEYPTRQQAQEVLYDLQHDKPAPLAVLDGKTPTRPDEHGYWTAPLGTIDGLAVEGSYHETDLFSAHLEWHGLKISTDGEHYLNLDIGDMTIGSAAESVGDMSLGEWVHIRSLAQTDVVERLIVLAKVHTTATPPA
jgi:hypothetical protein